VLGPKYRFACGFKSALVIVSDESKGSYYVDRDGKQPFACDEFSNLSNFSEDLARVRSKESGLYGYINRKGEWIIPAKWQDPASSAAHFRGGLALVAREADGKQQELFINRKGEAVWEPMAK
jgi:hypothetical protein